MVHHILKQNINNRTLHIAVGISRKVTQVNNVETQGHLVLECPSVLLAWKASPLRAVDLANSMVSFNLKICCGVH